MSNSDPEPVSEDIKPHWSENRRILKILITVMTTLLIAGLIALVFGMARTAKQMSEKGKAKAEIQDVVGDGEIILPAGSRLLSTTADQGRLFLTLDTDDGQMILIVDASSGRELGRLLLNRE